MELSRSNPNIEYSRDTILYQKESRRIFNLRRGVYWKEGITYSDGIEFIFASEIQDTFGKQRC